MYGLVGMSLEEDRPLRELNRALLRFAFHRFAYRDQEDGRLAGVCGKSRDNRSGSIVRSILKNR
jgi:hypothetical protein